MEATSFTPEQDALLLALPRYFTITAAAAAIGIGRRTVYSWIERENCTADPCFGAICFTHALARAKEEAIENLEARMFDRALNGDTAWDATRGIFLLKSLKRDVYGEQLQVKHSGTVWNASVDLNALEADERMALLQMAVEHERRALSAGEPSHPDSDDD